MDRLLLITRPPEGAERLLELMRADLGQVPPHVVSPLLRIVPVPLECEAAGDVVLSSIYGAARAAELGFSGVAWCVGDTTAEAARKLGFTAHSAEGDARDLLALIRRHAPHGRLSHVRGTHSRGRIAATLSDEGIACADLIAYDQQALPLTDAARAALSGEQRLVIPLFSPRSARLFSEQVAKMPAKADYIAISAAAAAFLPDHTRIAARPDMASMLAEILRAWRGEMAG